MTSLGFQEIPRRLAKGPFIKWMTSLNIPPEVLADALHQARSATTKKREQRHQRGTASRSSFAGFSDSELRTSLNLLGVGGTSDWSRRHLVQALQQIGIFPSDVRGVLHEVPLESGGRDGKPRRRPGPGRPGRPRSRAEREFYADGADHAEDFGRGGGRAQSRGRRGRRRSRYEYDDEDYEDVEAWLRREESYRRRGSWAEDWAEDAYARDENEDDFYNDYFEHHLDDEPWDDEDDEYFFSDMPRASGRQEPPQQRFRSYQSFAGEDSAGSRFADSRPPPWENVWRVVGGTAPAAASTPVAPEKVMARALQEGWSPERLTGSQATQLLGLSPRCTEEEVKAARKQMVHQWHPDRNPDNPNAGNALRLVIAAHRLLSGA